MSERLPLFSIEAEMGLLSSMMKSRDVASEILERLTGDEFSRPAHKLIFAAAREIVNANSAVDFVTMRDRLTQSAHLESVGGANYLIELSDFAPNPGGWEEYATIIIDRYKLRCLEISAHKILEIVHDPDIASTDQKIEDSQSQVSALFTRKSEDEHAGIQDVVRGIFADVDAAMERGTDCVTGISTGYPSIDSKFKLRPGSLYIIGSRPAMGKTGFAMNSAVKIAQAGHTVLFISLEMPKDAVVRRAMASVGKFPVAFTEGIALNGEDYERVSDAAEALHSLPIDIRDTQSESYTIDDLRSDMARTKRLRGSLGVVYVDFIQLMKVKGKSKETRAQELTDLAYACAALAKKYQCAIVALAQVSRAVENRDNKRPFDGDLSDSSGIEKAATTTMYLFRKEYYDSKEKGIAEEDFSECECIIRKNRGGKTGTAKLMFNGPYVRFTEAA